jgi:spermidine synthase
MVVTAFMVGLGLGSLAGGWISKSRKIPLLLVFGLAEMGIAVYGVVSLRIFHWAAIYTAGVPPLETGLIAFALVAIPTMLMGSTLPLLVAHTVRISGNVGTSVAALYAVNTLGSATACFLAGMLIMRQFGEAGSVRLAALLNGAVGLTVLLWFAVSRKYAGKRGGVVASGMAETAKNTANTFQPEPRSAADPNGPSLLNFPFAMVIVGISGFIALAYEIVWYRIFSFTTAGMAKSFAYLLGAYLIGIALGSLVAERLCHGRALAHRFLRWTAMFVLLANVVSFLVAPLLAEMVRYTSYFHELPVIALAAGLLGATFPLICHVSVRPDHQSGARLSYLYLSNIIGSALGSYLVGFVLMDYFHVREIAVILALLGIFLAIVLTVPAKFSRAQFYTAVSACLGAAIMVLAFSGPMFDALYERLLVKENYRPGIRFYQVSENKSGVVTVTSDGTVFGGGIYDGRYNLDLVNDTNGIFRAFFLPAVHAHPKNVLMIGFASGSWAQIIANDTRVEHFTIVEIDPGYFNLLSLHPEIAGVMKNPKVNVVVDDGRRWLVRNPSAQFDLIVINTTYNWRAHATNLLSSEFLRLIRKHLKPGGLHYFNTTGSDEVQATGVSVFPYGLRVGNFLLLSDSPIKVDPQRWRESLATYKIEGKPVFDLSRDFDRQRLEEVLSLAQRLGHPENNFFSIEDAESIRARTTGARLITDDNMGTEWSEEAGKWY